MLKRVPAQQQLKFTASMQTENLVSQVTENTRVDMITALQQDAPNEVSPIKYSERR